MATGKKRDEPAWCSLSKRLKKLSSDSRRLAEELAGTGKDPADSPVDLLAVLEKEGAALRESVTSATPQKFRAT